jgi:hypothetical protein
LATPDWVVAAGPGATEADAAIGMDIPAIRARPQAAAFNFVVVRLPSLTGGWNRSLFM